MPPSSLGLGALLLAFPYAAAGAWARHELQHGGLTRVYHVYTPGGNLRGLMLFLHGVGMTDSFPASGHISDWQVAANADSYGFVGVVPVGSPMTAAGKTGTWPSKDAWGSTSGGKRRLKTGAGALFEWNIDVPCGVNEVNFIHAVVHAVTTAHALPTGSPRLVLGFSNGAGLALLLGCHTSPNLWSAHVAVHYHPRADFPSTCNQAPSPCAEWSAIGDQDSFIGSLTPTPADGYRAQFSQLHANSGCPAQSWTVTTAAGRSCYAYTDCTALGQTCLWAGAGHDIKAGMTADAWTYLTGPHGSASCNATGPTPSPAAAPSPSCPPPSGLSSSLAMSAGGSLRSGLSVAAVMVAAATL